MTPIINTEIKKCLSKELTASFVKDFEMVTKTMGCIDFIKLFLKYDLNLLKILMMFRNKYAPLQKIGTIP